MNENDFVVGVLTYITCLREKKRYSTAKSYQDALRSFKCFCGREEIPYAYINRDTLLRYQSWLLAKGCARNTVSTYMRRIRHIYNLAVEVGVESKRKKALPSESLRLLMTSPVTDPQQKRTQSAFCLMFLFCGMAFVDLAHLRKEDIKEGILSYYRQKSGSLIQVEIPAEAQGLLNELAADTTEDSPYLFPFLEGMKTGEDAYKEYNTVLGGFNRRLKILSESIGIHTRVTSYTIRHSFATTLKEQNVPIEMISELLGHKSIKTTQIYLKSFSLEKLSTVNKLCFESVYNYAPKVG